MKLGEELVKQGLITREHLKIALERQVVFGGRVGTNLVELGILTEDEFVKFLSIYMKIPFAESSRLVSIDEEAISSITKQMAEKYKGVPFKKEKSRLHVAMLDPKNVELLNDFRFMSGYDVIPYAASELRVLYALEKYYGIQRDLRCISIFDRIEEGDKEVIAEDSTAPVQNLPKEELMKVKEAFSSVKNKEEIAGLLLQEAKRVARRVALFIVKGNTAAGWIGSELDVENIEISAALPSVFNEVLMKKTYSRGPVLRIPGNEELIKLLSGTPQDSLTIPINIRDRAIALLYADNGNDSVLNANLNYLNTLVAMASIAFEMLILKKKISDA